MFTKMFRTLRDGGIVQSAIARFRLLLAVLAYALISALSLVAAVLLGGSVPPRLVSLPAVIGALAVLVPMRLVVHRAHRLMTSRWRFVGTNDLVRLGSSVSVGSLVFAAVLLVAPGAVPGSRYLGWPVLVLDWVFTIYLTAAVWLLYRLQCELRSRNGSSSLHEKDRRALIVGAGEAGGSLAREIQRGGTGLVLAGFVDDDPLKRGAYVHGVKVHGTTADLPEVVKEVEAELIIIALPSASPEDMRRVVGACDRLDVESKVLPGIRAVLEGRASLDQIRPITIDDLLGRTPVHFALPVLAAEMPDAAVLITGAAGSIGSELARQIASNSPSKLILVDRAESELFMLQLELQRDFSGVEMEFVVGDVRNSKAMSNLIDRFEVTHLFHAAAFKHVPLMEQQPTEAIDNNVGSTLNLVRLAGEAGLQRFVLISTDKAVRPSNVMGATKRICELLLLDAVLRWPATRFTAVRFGNVLGSNGSVVPIFRRQLAQGRITVTHPDVTRYFMTIPEAVRLVLKASVMPEASGRIAMLEMGEPVRIVDLARNMIRLSGLTEGLDVEIAFTGLRPGEKLHEELVAPDEETVSTADGRIQLVQSRAPGIDLLPKIEDMLADAQAGHASDARRRLFEVISHVSPLASNTPAVAEA